MAVRQLLTPALKLVVIPIWMTTIYSLINSDLKQINTMYIEVERPFLEWHNVASGFQTINVPKVFYYDKNTRMPRSLKPEDCQIIKAHKTKIIEFFWQAVLDYDQTVYKMNYGDWLRLDDEVHEYYEETTHNLGDWAEVSFDVDDDLEWNLEIGFFYDTRPVPDKTWFFVGRREQ